MTNIVHIIKRAEKIEVELENLSAIFDAANEHLLCTHFGDAAVDVSVGIQELVELARRGVEDEGQSGEQGQD